MARKYDIETPDGKKITIEGPDDATDDELIDFAHEHLKGAGSKFAKSPVAINHPKSGADGIKPENKGLPALFTQGATFGLADEIAGGAGAVMDAVQAPFSDNVDFDPANSYQKWRDLARSNDDLTRKESPWLGGAAEIAGGIASLPAKALASTQSLLAAIKSAPKIGALTGGLAGFGYGEGTDSSLAGAGVGAALGAGLGVALPAVGSAAGRVYNAARDFSSPRNGIARGLVANAMKADAVAPRAAGQAMQEANERGVPSMLADQGDNLRGLLASVGRKPGPSQRLVRNAVEERQAQQGNRVRGAIERDLGPTANPFEVSDRLSRQAQAAAAPLYDKAYSLPLTVPEGIAELMARPSVKRALGNARSIAAEEGRNPSALGFVETPDGSVTLPNAPSLQTYDYLKRGLDDVLDGYRNKLTGRLDLDTEGRAIEGTRRALVGQLDEAGEAGAAYKEARAAFAGPAGQKAALAKGQSAINLSDQELERAVANLKPGEKEQFALGLRSALADNLERRVDGGDKVQALLGTPRKRKALAQVFGGEENFSRFMSTMADEAQAAKTYKSVATGSQTAERLAADAGTDDTALLQDLAGSAIKGGAQGGMTGAIAELLNRAKDVGKFGAGKTGERARQEVGALLSETDPAALAEAMRKALRDQALRRVRQHLQLRSSIRAVNIGARGVGGVSGRSLRQPE